MVKDFFSAADVARVLDIYEVSTRELLAGTIEFEDDEIYALACAADVSVERLIG